MARKFIGNVKGVGVSAIYKQYYASTSASSLVGGAWTDSVPTLNESLYLWSRWKAVLTNGETTTTEAVQEGISGSDLTNLATAINELETDMENFEASLGDVATKDVVPPEMGGTGVQTVNAIGLMAYPVGAVFISYEATSPEILFGGTWTEITGVFPYFNAGTDTGGSNTHTLTVEEMPSHNHSATIELTNEKLASGSTYSRVNNGGTEYSNLVNIANTGGGQPHNNMPAYQEFYAWRRTA